MSLPQVSRASRSRLPGRCTLPATIETFGRRSQDAFASYDRDGRCWRTAQLCFFRITSARYSRTWPRAGLMLGGTAFQLAPLAPITKGIGSGSSPYVARYPTPSAVRYGSSGNGVGNNTTSRGRPSLETMARKNLWPTPTASDWKNRETSRRRTVLQKEIGGPLSPWWLEWLMGAPIGWTELGPLDLARFLQWCEQFGSCCRE